MILITTFYDNMTATIRNDHSARSDLASVGGHTIKHNHDEQSLNIGLMDVGRLGFVCSLNQCEQCIQAGNWIVDNDEKINLHVVYDIPPTRQEYHGHGLFAVRIIPCSYLPVMWRFLYIHTLSYPLFSPPHREKRTL